MDNQRNLKINNNLCFENVELFSLLISFLLFNQSDNYIDTI